MFFLFMESKINYNNFNLIQDNNFENDIILTKNLLKIKNECPVFLTLCYWGYPPYGGGENWLIDVMKYMDTQKYNSVMICFYDTQLNCQFEKLNIIIENNLTFIQFPKNEDILLIKLIKYLNPSLCHHQGMHRLSYMKLCNVLNIPFITGFGFWGDIIDMNKNYTNINILKNDQLIPSKNFNTILKYSNPYVSSDFVNDVVFKFHDKKIPVIESVSNINHFNVDIVEKKYITLININYYKNGWLLPKLLLLDLPFLLIDTERNSKKFNEKLKQIISLRKKYKHKVLWIQKKVDIKKIYKKTKILLIGSLVDETFCKTAYEGMKLKIPIFSTKNGNLRYLLDGYADYLNEDVNTWSATLLKYYSNEEYLLNMSLRNPINYIDEKIVFNKFDTYINNVILNKKNFNLNNKNIGLFIPWTDQGLGIQAREYYLELSKNDYNPCVMSFKPYLIQSTDDKNYSNYKEWKYDNIHYYSHKRDKINMWDIVDFIFKTKISSVILIELCYSEIFNISYIFKLFGVKIIGIPNIETTRYNEIYKHKIFDLILTNNNFTQNVFEKLNIPSKYLGFQINHPYFQLKKLDKKYKNINENENEKISFFCIGGLNSIKRKHIDIVCEIFDTLSQDLNIQLFVFMQGVEKIKENYSNVIFVYKNMSYYDISNIYKTHDIFIHMGSHEGLGLGYYESIACGTPILTINAPPSNEIIKHNFNGWLVNTTKFELEDNSKAIIYGDLFDKNDFIEKIFFISKTFNKKKIYENIKNDTQKEFNLINAINSI